MKEKIFRAASMTAGLKQVSEALGSDAMILKSRRVGDEVELTALADDDPDLTLTDHEKDDGDRDHVKVEFNRARERMLAERLKSLTDQVESTATRDRPKEKIDSARPDTMSPDFSAYDKLLASIGGKQATNEPLNRLLDQQLEDRTENYSSCNNLLLYARKMGLSSSVCQRLHAKDCFAYSGLSIAQPWRRCMQVLADLLPISDEKNRQTAAISAFIGPSGGGKTTTLSKLATRHVLQFGNHNLALIGFDNYRMAADDQLRKLAQLLDVPVRFVSSNDSLDAVLTSVNERPFIYLDTAGLGMADRGLRNQLRALDHSVFRLKKVLVLPANLQEGAIRSVIDTFASKDIDSCILTKLDDCASLGEPISVLVEEQIPLAYVTNGPNIPEDLQIARSEEVVREACRMMQCDPCESHADGNLGCREPISTNVGLSY